MGSGAKQPATQEWDFNHSLQVENIYMLLLMSKGSLLERLFFISPI